MVMTGAFNVTWGADYFVTQDGVDDAGRDGSASAPWATVAYAAGRADGSGDVINIGAGTFTETTQVILQSGVGLKGNGARGASRTIVTAQGLGSSHFGGRNGHIVKVVDAHGCTISDIHFDGNSRDVPGAITIERSSDVVVHDVVVAEFSHTGLWIDSCNGIELRNDSIANSGSESTSYCAGNIWLLKVRNSSIHHTKIYAHAENSGYGIKATGGLIDFDVYDCVFDLKKSAAWAGGLAGNMDIEYWSGNEGEWGNNQIYNNIFDRTVSMDMRNAVVGDYSVWIHHNTFVLPDRTYAVEVSSSKMTVSHNYFTDPEGDDAGDIFHDYKSLTYTDISIHHNVITNARNSFFTVHAEIHNLKIYNNTVYFGHTWAEPTFVRLDDKDHGYTYRNLHIVNNIIDAFKPTTFMSLGTGASHPDAILQGNLHNADVAGLPAGNTEGDAELQLSGERPDPYYVPTGVSSNVVDIANGYDMGDTYAGSGPDAGAYEMGVETVIGRDSSDIVAGVFHDISRQPYGAVLSLPDGPIYDLRGRLVGHAGRTHGLLCRSIGRPDVTAGVYVTGGEPGSSGLSIHPVQE